MQADGHSNVTMSREQKRLDGIIPLIHDSLIIHFIHPCLYSWVLGVVNIFSAASATPLLVSYQDSLMSWAPFFADCQWKGQPSFSQRRMSLLVPHPPQCVHKNLHNSSRKCQDIGAHGDKALTSLFLSTLLRRIAREQTLSKQTWQVMNHAVFSWLITLYAQKRAKMSFPWIFLFPFWLQCVKERLTSSGESEPE